MGDDRYTVGDVVTDLSGEGTGRIYTLAVIASPAPNLLSADLGRTSPPTLKAQLIAPERL